MGWVRAWLRIDLALSLSAPHTVYCIACPELPEGSSPRALTFHYGNNQDDIDSTTVHRYHHGHDNDCSWRYAYFGLNRLVGAVMLVLAGVVCHRRR